MPFSSTSDTAISNPGTTRTSQPVSRRNSGTSYLASTGDVGAYYGPNYPSISPLVAGIGGTNLNVSGNNYSSESAWSAGGGGISSEYGAPGYQSGVTGYSARTNPDVSSAAVGVSVYDPYDYGGWVVADGTSWSSPTWAGFTAVANQGRVDAGRPDLRRLDSTVPVGPLLGLHERRLQQPVLRHHHRQQRILRDVRIRPGDGHRHAQAQ